MGITSHFWYFFLTVEICERMSEQDDWKIRRKMEKKKHRKLCSTHQSQPRRVKWACKLIWQHWSCFFERFLISQRFVWPMPGREWWLGCGQEEAGLGITAVKTDARYVKFGATHNVGCSAVHISLHCTLDWRVVLICENGGEVGQGRRPHRMPLTASSCKDYSPLCLLALMCFFKVLL